MSLWHVLCYSRRCSAVILHDSIYSYMKVRLSTIIGIYNLKLSRQLAIFLRTASAGVRITRG